MSARLLGSVTKVATAGIDLLADAVAGQGADVTRTEWRPPMAGTESDLARVMADRGRPAANAEALRRMTTTEARLVDVVAAGPALGLGRGDFLHAGPPIEWDRASGPLRGALQGAALLEGLAPDAAAAEALFASRRGYTLRPCHGAGAVGPMAGVVSASMWLFVVEDGAGHRAYCSLNEGLGRVLRYGAYSPDVLDRLRWMSAVLGPMLQRAVRAREPIDLRAMIAQALHMGDEGHNRNRAGTLIFLRELLPQLMRGPGPERDVAEAVRFVSTNDHFFLNLSMPACKVVTDAARGIAGSTMVVAMARNGTDFGIQVSATGDEWFTGPAQLPQGLFLGGYGPADANPDIGDSAITETAGIGGFAMAGAPAIVRFVGGDAQNAIDTTLRMYEITLGEHPLYTIPLLDFRGTPAGIDVARVVRTGILPQINSGMAGKVAGVGQVGAGLVTPPAEIFPKALAALARRAG